MLRHRRLGTNTWIKAGATEAVDVPQILTSIWTNFQSILTGIPANAITYETQLQELTRIGFGLNADAALDEWQRCLDRRAFAQTPYIALLRELGGCDDNRIDNMSMEDYVTFEASGELEGAFFCQRLVFIVFGEILCPGEFGRMLRRAAAILDGGFEPQDIQETVALLDDNDDVVPNPSAELSFTLDGTPHTWTFTGSAESICAELLSKLRQATDAASGAAAPLHD